MQINGYELNLSEEKLDDIITHQMRKIELIGQDFESYQNLPEGDRKALSYLVKAAYIIDNIALKQDHPLNIFLKESLIDASKTSKYAQKALVLFDSLHGVAGLNGIDPEPIEIFKGVKIYPGKNFYPTDLSAEEFHQILIKMFANRQINEIKKILSSRTMVRRDGAFLKAIDYTEFFAQEYSEIANLLELAAHYSTEEEFKDYLGWQAQAFLQNNEEMDAIADKHWAVLELNNLEFTVSRENYEDEMTPTVFENEELQTLIEKYGIEVNAKDTLGCRVGLVNKEGTNIILKSKETLPYLASLMPYKDLYEQNIEKNTKQTMVDVDLMLLTGDYAFARGGITTAQNLPNDDKLAVKTGGGRRNVYHRQVRFSYDQKRLKQLLDALLEKTFHPFVKESMRHFFVIGHENGHSLGPNSSYKASLGSYAHIMEENKADVISIAFMEDLAKTFGLYTSKQLKEIYATWIVGLFLRAKPVLSKPHRVADLIQFNYLMKHEVVFLDGQNKLHIKFDLISQTMKKLLSEIIEIQLSKSPQKAKDFVFQWSKWTATSKYIASVQKKLGLKPYIKIITKF